MDYATRTFDNAARNLERLRLDYPLTPYFAQAAYWAGRTYFELKDTTRACRRLADGIARAEKDLELKRQLGFMYQRCDVRVAAADTNAAGAPADTTPKPRPAQADSAAGRVADSLPDRAATPAPRFRVQVAAVATPGAADDAASKAEGLGFPAVIVRERGLYKVRAGAFVTRQEAQAAVPKLKAGIGGSPFVVAEP
jgi:septal ring-binding cell division protein DamX